MLASRGLPFRGALKRDDRRCARHFHNAALVPLTLAELREEFPTMRPPVAPTKREVAVPSQFRPSFLLADMPAPTKYVEVTVTRKSVSQRKPVVETLMFAA